MQIDHPALREIEVRHQIGRAEAESILRGSAAHDPKAAQAIKEIDAERSRRKSASVSRNEAMAKSLGLSPDEARDLVGKLAADRELFTWLTSRVHVTILHDRPLDHDE